MFWGKAKVIIDGKVLAESDGSVKCTLGGRPRKTIKTSTAILGTIPGKVVPGAVEGDFIFATAAEALALTSARGVTVQFVMDNGEAFVIRDAAQVNEEPKIEGSDEGGKITGLKFEGKPAEAVTGGETAA